MKNSKGILFIIAILGITLAVWLTAVPSAEITGLDRARHIVGGVMLSGFMLVFLLSTRNKWVTQWFNGLENVYVFHKFLAISSVVGVIVHAILGELITILGDAGLESFNFSMLTSAANAPIQINAALGTAATAMFAILILITLFSKSLKYEKWRITHRLMLVAYTLGLTHTYLSSKYDLLQWNALGIWVGLTAVVSIASGLYIIFVYQKREFKHEGKVTGIQKLSPDVLELEISLAKPMSYSKGQFIFIKFFQEGLLQDPHPFSVSGGDGNTIRLTIKNSGDFTNQLYDSLDLDSRVTLAGPYGKMDFTKGRQQQLWIAGGIGITPFISYLDGNTVTQNIEMYYSYQGQDAAIYRSILEEYQNTHENFTVHFTDTSSEERLTFDNYPLKDNTSIFMCGPTGMMNHFAKTFKAKGTNAELVFEGFKFR